MSDHRRLADGGTRVKQQARPEQVAARVVPMVYTPEPATRKARPQPLVRLRRSPRPRPTYDGRRGPGDRALTAFEIDALVSARAAGASVETLQRDFRLGRRTVYRWMGARIVTATLDGWSARFAIRPLGSQVREGPVQIEHWREVAEP